MTLPCTLDFFANFTVYYKCTQLSISSFNYFSDSCYSKVGAIILRRVRLCQADIIFRPSVSKRNDKDEKGLILNTREALFGPIWENVCCYHAPLWLVSKVRSEITIHTKWKTKLIKIKCVYESFFFLSQWQSLLSHLSVYRRQQQSVYGLRAF